MLVRYKPVETKAANSISIRLKDQMADNASQIVINSSGNLQYTGPNALSIAIDGVLRSPHASSFVQSLEFRKVNNDDVDTF